MILRLPGTAQESTGLIGFRLGVARLRLGILVNPMAADPPPSDCCFAVELEELECRTAVRPRE